MNLLNIPENETIGERMRALGFEIWNMGGGCMAYGRSYPSGAYDLLTEDCGGQLPSDLNGEALFGQYEDAEDDDGELVKVTNLGVFLATLESVASRGERLFVVGPAALPEVGQRVRFRAAVERFPYGIYEAGRTAVVTEASADCIYARLENPTQREADDLAEWDGCVQWAGDYPDPDQPDKTVAEWFWDDCEVMA